MLSPTRGVESAAIRTPPRVLSPRPPAIVSPSGLVVKLASPNPADFIARKNGEQYESSLCNDEWTPVGISMSPVGNTNAVVVPIAPLLDPTPLAVPLPPPPPQTVPSLEVNPAEIQQHLLVLSSALETSHNQQEHLFNNFTQALAQRDKDWEEKVKTERHQIANVIDSMQVAVANEKMRDEATYAAKLNGIAEMCSKQVNELQQKLVDLATQAQEAVSERDELLHKSREEQVMLQNQLSNVSSAVAQQQVQEHALQQQLQSVHIQHDEMNRQRILNQIHQQQQQLIQQQQQQQQYQAPVSMNTMPGYLSPYVVPPLGNCFSAHQSLPSTRSPSVVPQDASNPFIKKAYSHLQRHQSHIESQRRSSRSVSSSVTTSFPTIPYFNMTEL